MNIAPDWLMLRQGGAFAVLDHGLSEDVRKVGAGYDEDRDVFYLLLESESFDPVPDDAPLPTLPPIYLKWLAEGEEWIRLEQVR